MIGLIIICCMLTFLVGGGYYFFTNPIIIPKIEINFLIKEIHPAERPGGSGGDAKDDYTQLSKNIDVGIQWQNDENAFGKFEEIIARRFVGGEKKKEIIFKKNDYPKLFKKNKTGLQIVFYGKDNTYDITGENEVHLYYKNELGIEVQLTSSDMKKNEIKKEDLDRSLKLADSEIYTYDTTGGETKTSADFTGKGYHMYMCSIGDILDMVTKNLVDVNLEIGGDRKFYIVPNKDSNSKFSIKLQDSLFGTVDDNGTIGLVDKLSSNVIIFEMLEGSFDKSKRFKPSGTDNEGKFLVYSGETDGKLMFKNINDMNEQEYQSMDIIVTEEDTYTANMCMDTLASSQNSDGSDNSELASSSQESASESASSSTQPLTSSTVSFTGRPDEGTYYIQNVGSDLWGEWTAGNGIRFNRSGKGSTNSYKFEVIHDSDPDQIRLKNKSTDKECTYDWTYEYTGCSMSNNFGMIYKTRKLNVDTYFIEVKTQDVWRKCHPHTSDKFTSARPYVLGCATGLSTSGIGETGETSQMFKFVTI